MITPEAEPQRVIEVALAAVRGGADVIQLRHKTLARGDLLTLARDLRRRITEALFIVNDHVDIALLSRADGVHLGPDDLSVQAARQVAGDHLLIGASAWAVDSARDVVAEGADYLGTGPAFPTPVKSTKAVIGPRGIAAIESAVGGEVPVFAIGGIDSTNLGQLISAGPRRICVIRAVANSPDPESAARRLRAMLHA